MDDNVDMTDDDWKRRLAPEQYRVLRRKGTEAPFSGRLLRNDKSGDYTCAGCGALLFKSDAKYDSKLSGLEGWPSFDGAAFSGALELKPDPSFGMYRTEITCKQCGGHLGHLFDDPSSPTNQHYCVNSAALEFVAEKSGHPPKPAS